MGSTSSSLLRRSLLDRAPVASASITPLQSQVDGLVGGFAAQATDWRSLASMAAGGMAYRVGRLGIMGLGSGTALRVASLGIGLGAEVSAFEITHRSLSSIGASGHGENPNLWRWSGQGGIRQGLLNSFVTFGTLKGAGHLAQGQNLIAQHLFQDTGMVLGHQFAGALGISDRPTGSLAEQFLHAEATNIQLGAGMALAHGMTPGMHALERGLDLSMPTANLGIRSSRPGEEFLQNGLQPAFAVAGEGSSVAPENARPEPKGPTILMMNDTEGSGGESGPLPKILNGQRSASSASSPNEG